MPGSGKRGTRDKANTSSHNPPPSHNNQLEREGNNIKAACVHQDKTFYAHPSHVCHDVGTEGGGGEGREEGAGADTQVGVGELGG
jgi:hypothetical protein